MEVTLSTVTAMQICALHLQITISIKDQATFFNPAAFQFYIDIWVLSTRINREYIHSRPRCLSPSQPHTLPQHYVMHGASLGLPGVALYCTW